MYGEGRAGGIIQVFSTAIATGKECESAGRKGMKKRCTNSACRRYFNNLGTCPYCGKVYSRPAGSNDLILLEYEPRTKIKIIKEIRTWTGLGLKEAKALADFTPSVVLKGAGSKEAAELEKSLKLLGARVAIRKSSGK